MEITSSEDMEILAKHFKTSRLIRRVSKTETCCFHLHNQLAKRELKISFSDIHLNHNHYPKNLEAILDRSLTINNVLLKLTGTSCGANDDVLRITVCHWCTP